MAHVSRVDGRTTMPQSETSTSSRSSGCIFKRPKFTVPAGSSTCTLGKSAPRAAVASINRNSVQTRAASDAAATINGQTLGELPISPILNTQGLILPPVPEGTKATVFAIFDEGKKVQYVGFSKDCRNSLRTVFTRRPDKAFYYKALHLPTLDQKAMLDIRSDWFDQIGGQPNGNRLAIERNQWQLPVSSGAISDRGKQQAAEKEVEKLRTIFASRGCKEELIADPDLLADGKVDFLPAKALTAEDLARQEEIQAARSRNLRNVVTVIDGNQTNFKIFVEASYKSKGGYYFDVKVTYEERETSHRVIIGKEYYEDFDIQPEQVLDRAFAFLLSKKIHRQTEGLMVYGEFPINYFSISTIEQYFDDFAEAFLDTGKELRGDAKFWRFNRIHTYGAHANAPAKQIEASSPA